MEAYVHRELTLNIPQKFKFVKIGHDSRTFSFRFFQLVYYWPHHQAFKKHREARAHGRKHIYHEAKTNVSATGYRFGRVYRRVSLVDLAYASDIKHIIR